MFKKILYTIALTAVAVTNAQGQRGIGRLPIIPRTIYRPPVIVRPHIYIAPPMYSPNWCYEYYDYYPCAPLTYRPIPHRTVVVIIGNNNPVQKEIVDTVYVKDSTMKDTIKVIKHN